MQRQIQYSSKNLGAITITKLTNEFVFYIRCSSKQEHEISPQLKAFRRHSSSLDTLTTLERGPTPSSHYHPIQKSSK
jgi:hypothetical protein